MPINEDPNHSPVTFGPAFSARSLMSSERFTMLQRRESYAECSQHHHKIVDFDGNMRAPGPPTLAPLFTMGPAPFFAPLSARYPRAQYPLAKLITRAFSALLFGDDKSPTFKYPGDDDATDYANALANACALWTAMHQARNWGGGCGTVGLSWSFHDGKPRVEVHRAKHLFVHEWADRKELIPEKVSEVYTYANLEFDERKNRFVNNWYWYHRYWDTERDILFEPCPVRENGKVVEPVWVPAEVAQHDDGEAHFVWIQNIPHDEIDGIPDYEGSYDDFDDLDVVYSVLTRGTTLNLDPTLVLMRDKAKAVISRQVSKGSDNALDVGESGDAKYLEIAGTSVTAGIALFDKKRNSILESAECILADPNEVAASGISSVAMKLIYAPMLSAANVRRGTYGKGAMRLLAQMMRVARARQGTESVKLPPRVVTEEDAVGEKTEKLVERKPGTSEDLENVWPAYFPATPDDRSKDTTSLSTAAGGKQIISVRTANEEAAKSFGKDPAEEWKRLQSEQQSDHETAAKAFTDADAGGRSTELTKPLPGDGELKISSTGAGDKPPPPPPGAPGMPPGGNPAQPGGGGAPGAPGGAGKPGGGFAGATGGGTNAPPPVMPRIGKTKLKAPKPPG